jgi:Asp-tRNA(Asn)/Glu-tRNA(Gln) amidotransferase A subunit family amidase
MRDENLIWTPATELATMIRQREVSPVDVCRAVLARIDALDDRVGAFITLDREGAERAARAAEDAVASGVELGPLHGVPVSIKDLFHVAGLRTTFGSKFFENSIAERDSVSVARLRAAGAVILGKTNTPAFGHKDMSDNLLGPPARNPWKLDRTAGGSSGGAAAAAAAGMGPLALGSDGAGSIRIPAALCGIFGIKPSLGRVPHAPNNDYWGGRSHIGPMTRTVRDAALMLRVMAGPDAGDPLSIDSEPEDYLAWCERGVEGLRVAWSPDFGYAPVNPEVRRLTAAAAGRFSELGCEVVEANPDWPNPAEWHAKLYDGGTAARQAKAAEERPDWIDPSMAEAIERGKKVSLEEYVGATAAARSELYNHAIRFMASYDLLLSPAMPCGAWPVDGTQAEIDGTPTPRMLDRLQFMFPFNMTGWPAATVPCGFTSEGLPVGLQIVAPWHQDALCLQAAAAFERVQPWSDRRPDL